MATEVRHRRGTTVQHSTFTGAAGEITVDTTKNTAVVHDGTTAGGIPLAKESTLTGKAGSGANSDITSLSGLTTPLSIAQGGTGATTAAGARTALGAQIAGSYAASGANTDITSLGNNTSTIYTTGGSGTAYTLTPTPAISSYAIGQSFVVNFNTASGASPTITISGVGTPPNLVKQNPDGSYSNIAANDISANHRSRVTLISTTQALVEKLKTNIIIGTTQALTSGSVKDFPVVTGCKEFSVQINNLSHASATFPWLQLGTSSGFVTSGYESSATTNGVSSSATGGVILSYRADAASQHYGTITGRLLDSTTNTWLVTGTTGYVGAADTSMIAGQVTLPGELTQIRLTSAAAATFDGGSANTQSKG